MIRRRSFVSTLAAGALAPAGASWSAAEDGRPYRVGLIGCGWYGDCDLHRLMDVAKVEVVSLCDVDGKALAESADMVVARGQKKPNTFADYRKMLESGKHDVILIGTPDHWHALTGIAAIEHGADVYLQKPISVDVAEGQALVAAARKYKRVVQIGTQRRSTKHLAAAKEFVKSGALGKIGAARAFCYYNMRGPENPKDGPPPDHLDFDMWTGPAPLRAYNSLIHPRSWRRFMEYGNGIIGDMGVHMLDLMRFILGVGWPKKVASTGGIYVFPGKSNITDTQTVTFDYGDFEAVWEHRTWGTAEDPEWTWGLALYGERGLLRMDLKKWEFKPHWNGGKPQRMEHESVKQPDVHNDGDDVVPANRRHQQNFLECIKSRAKPVADVEEGFVSTGMCILGNISQQLGRSLTWDAAALKVVGDEEANKLLKRPYRAPWKHPAG
jgi:predicted dehydrogenase